MSGMAWLLDQLAQKLSSVLDSMTGSAVEIGQQKAAPAGGELWWRQDFGAIEGAVSVGCPAAVWNEIGKRGLQAAGIEAAEPADVRSTYLEILTQALSALTQSITSLVGFEVTLSNGREPAQGGAGVEDALTIRFPGAEPGLVFVNFSDDLLRMIDGQPSVGGTATQPAGNSFSPAIENSKTLDVLMEVEMPVSVSFGRSQIPLKDVIKLTTGSIVELNRSVSEPVEVIVNNCVVARGEVVVIEGNYGVRIEQIITLQERLRTLS